MRRIASESPTNPEFARVVRVAALPRSGEFAFDLSPNEAEARALARLLAVRSVRKMRFQGALRPVPDGWALEADLGATVLQSCVVTLEPVTTRVDVPVRRRFVPMPARAAEVEVLPDEDDETEPLAEALDLGLVAIEALALALPDYPRSPAAADVVLAEPEPEDGEAKPFAALAALRDKLGRQE